jgi:V8-like Glu-specific endopeptidase
MSRSLLVVVLAAGMAALLLLAGAARSLAADTSIVCTTPGDVVCSISDADGIQAVRVAVATATGLQEVVNETFPCASTASVSWTPLAPDYQIEVDDCDGQSAVALGFDGLLHQPIGDAVPYLHWELKNAMVTSFSTSGAGDQGLDIVLSSFQSGGAQPGASQWEAWLLPAEPAGVGGFEARVFGDDLLNPVAAIQFSHHITDVWVPVPSFDGAAYGVSLYHGSDLVHQQSGIPSGGQTVWLPQWLCAAFAEILDCAPRLIFGLDPATGWGYWEVNFPEPVGVDTPAGRVEVDRMRFAAEGGAGLRAFQRVQLLVRNIPFLTIFGESVQAPLTDKLLLPLITGGAGEPDPFGLGALTQALEDPTPPTGDVRINDWLLVRAIGPGNLIEDDVVEPEASEQEPGVREPDEPDTGLPAVQQTLRVFNTANKMEYEIVVEGALLQQLHSLSLQLGDTGANPGPGGPGADGLPGFIPPRLPTPGANSLLPFAPDGWSGGVDNRTRLTATTSWPWRTIVHFSNNCSGALVGPRHILTAAHCINKRGTNNWYSFTVSPGRNGASKPYGDSAMNPNPQPGDPFRWYFTPAQWRSSQYNDANCGTTCWAASQWDWGLIIIPEHLGYQTGWMGYVARPAGQLNVQSHFNRGYPWCGTDKGNAPAGCVAAGLYGDTNTCALGTYSFPGPDNWNRIIRNSCDISGGHSGSPIYHYFYDTQLGKVVPVASMVVIWEHCYTCSATDTFPNSARRLTPGDLGTISFFRQWKP